MRRTGARLTLPGAMYRQAPSDTGPTAQETSSASLALAERQIKALQSENQRLRTDLEDTRSLYNQLVQENEHERFDERRVTLLKSQVIQLERQVLLLSEALGCRGNTLLEVENDLTWLADRCRTYIAKEVRGPEVNIPRSELTMMVETAESARIKLYKQIENTATESLARPLKFYSEFIRPSRNEDVTLMDVASGDLDHINLKHVTKLETKLSSLYRQLVGLHSAIEQDTQGYPSCIWSSGHVTSAVRERLMTQILRSCALMKDCTSDLLDLSLLIPSAPWPPLKKSALRDVTCDRVLKSLPSFPRSKTSDAHKVISALVKAYNYKVFMLHAQAGSLRQEITYHQRVYNIQLKYTESLFQTIREGYSKFEETSNEVIAKPLQDILATYVELNQSTSEESLKKFLSAFKESAPQLADVVEAIAVKDTESEGSKVLSAYGEEFFQSLEKLVADEQNRRDREAMRCDDIRQEQQKLDQELQEILYEQESRLQASRDMSNLTLEDKGASVIVDTEASQTDSKHNRQETDKVIDAIDKGVKVKKKKSLSNKILENKTSEAFVQEKVDSVCEKVDKMDTNIEAEKHSRTCDVEMKQENTMSSSAPTKSKVKLGYVPNTFVPNRTLQLRRSGSLTRLSSAADRTTVADQSTAEAQEHAGNMAARTDCATTNTSGVKEKHKSRPPFR